MVKITKKHADIALTYEADSIDEIMELITTHERADDNKTAWASMPKVETDLTIRLMADKAATDRAGTVIDRTHPAFPSVFAPVNFAEYLEEKAAEPGPDREPYVYIHMTPRFRDDLASYLRHPNPYASGDMALEMADDVASTIEGFLPLMQANGPDYVVISMSVGVRDKIVSALRLQDDLSHPGEIIVGEPIKWELPEEMKAAIVRLECAAAAMEDRDYSRLSYRDLTMLERKIKNELMQKAERGGV